MRSIYQFCALAACLIATGCGGTTGTDTGGGKLNQLAATDLDSLIEGTSVVVVEFSAVW